MIILYHPQSEYGRIVEDYAHDFEQRGNGHDVDLLSLETPEGAAAAALYDIVRYPAILVVDDTKRLHKEWQGPELPQKDEVAGYLAA